MERIIEAAQAEVSELLSQHRDKLDALAQALLASETLGEAEAYAAAGVARVAEGEQLSGLAPVSTATTSSDA